MMSQESVLVIALLLNDNDKVICPSFGSPVFFSMLIGFSCPSSEEPIPIRPMKSLFDEGDCMFFQLLEALHERQYSLASWLPFPFHIKGKCQFYRVQGEIGLQFCFRVGLLQTTVLSSQNSFKRFLQKRFLYSKVTFNNHVQIKW